MLFIMIKNCVLVVKSEDTTNSYCLKYKIWKRTLIHCPKRCDYFVEGEGGKIEEVERRKYEMECIYFSRMAKEIGNSMYYCTLMEQEKPYCAICLFACFPTDPEEERIELND